MTTIQEIINGDLLSNNLTLQGIGGNGYINAPPQSAKPTTPVSGYGLYSNSASNLTIIRSDGFARTLNLPTSADVIYTIPNVGSSSMVMTQGSSTINGTLTATNLSGTNSGDLTLAPVGSTPSPAGASLSGQVLTLQPADENNPGIISTGVQTFGGAKTFAGSITINQLQQDNVDLPTTTATTGRVIIGGNRVLHSYGTGNIFVGNNSGNFTLTGTGNTTLGNQAGTALTTGTGNILIGSSAGSAITNTGSNILIGSAGVSGDTNVMRLGTAQTNTYVAGVANATPDFTSQLVFVNPTDNRLWANSAFPLQSYILSCTISTGTGTISSWITGGTFEVTSATGVPIWCIITGNVAVVTIPAFAFVCSSNTNSLIRFTVNSGGTIPFTSPTSNIKWWSIPVNSNNTTQNGIISLVSSTIIEITRNPTNNFAQSAQGVSRRVVLAYNITR